MKWLKLSLFVVLPLFAAQAQTAADPLPLNFFWQRVFSRGLHETYQIELAGSGAGTFHFERQGGESIDTRFSLRPTVVDALHEMFKRADFLNPGKEFVSQVKVADTGMKTIRLEENGAHREVCFNYTQDRSLQQVVEFFENLCIQEQLVFEMELALKYQKLTISAKLDRLEKELKANRIVASERFSPLLERIYNDQSIMNIARVQAKQLRDMIEKPKK